MKANIVKGVILPTTVLTVICILITFILAYTNSITKDKIAEQQTIKLAESQKVVLPNCETFEEIAENAYEGKDASGNTGGYVFVTSATGYGGPIEVMTGIDSDGKISGINILSHSETPGLGAKATEDSFKGQYSGLDANQSVAVTKDGGTIDAISGATITSRAVSNAVNEAIEMYKTVKEGVN